MLVILEIFLEDKICLTQLVIGIGFTMNPTLIETNSNYY